MVDEMLVNPCSVYGVSIDETVMDYTGVRSLKYFSPHARLAGYAYISTPLRSPILPNFHLTSV